MEYVESAWAWVQANWGVIALAVIVIAVVAYQVKVNGWRKAALQWIFIAEKYFQSQPGHVKLIWVVDQLADKLPEWAWRLLNAYAGLQGKDVYDLLEDFVQDVFDTAKAMLDEAETFLELDSNPAVIFTNGHTVPPTDK